MQRRTVYDGNEPKLNSTEITRGESHPKCHQNPLRSSGPQICEPTYGQTTHPSGIHFTHFVQRTDKIVTNRMISNYWRSVWNGYFWETSQTWENDHVWRCYLLPKYVKKGTVTDKSDTFLHYGEQQKSLMKAWHAQAHRRQGKSDENVTHFPDEVIYKNVLTSQLPSFLSSS